MTPEDLHDVLRTAEAHLMDDPHVFQETVRHTTLYELLGAAHFISIMAWAEARRRGLRVTGPVQVFGGALPGDLQSFGVEYAGVLDHLVHLEAANEGGQSHG